MLAGPLPSLLKQVFVDLDQHGGVVDWLTAREMGNLASYVGNMTPIQHKALREEILARYNAAPKGEHARTILEMPRRVLDLLIAYEMNPSDFVTTRLKKARFWQNKKQIARAAYVDYLKLLHESYPGLKGGTLAIDALFETIAGLQTYLREQASAGGKIQTLTIFGSVPNGLASTKSDLDLMIRDGKDPFLRSKTVRSNGARNW